MLAGFSRTNLMFIRPTRSTCKLKPDKNIGSTKLAHIYLFTSYLKRKKKHTIPKITQNPNWQLDFEVALRNREEQVRIPNYGHLDRAQRTTPTCPPNRNHIRVPSKLHPWHSSKNDKSLDGRKKVFFWCVEGGVWEGEGWRGRQKRNLFRCINNNNYCTWRTGISPLADNMKKSTWSQQNNTNVKRTVSAVR